MARSTLDKTIKKVSAALEGTYEELLVALPFENVLNVDETGHKDNGQPWWTWCLRADLYTIYKVDALRSAERLGETYDAWLEAARLKPVTRAEIAARRTAQFRDRRYAMPT